MSWTRSLWGDVFVVCDGMGGHRGGGRAAEITLQALQRELVAIDANSQRFGDAVRHAFELANGAVRERRDPFDPETREMGSTAVAAISDGRRLMVAHAGDSRAYLFRRHRGLRRLTRDHSRVQTLMDAGRLAAIDAPDHPQANLLDRAIGLESTVEVDTTDWLPLEHGDQLLLCTDGLSAFVPDATIEAVLRSSRDPQDAADRLVEDALAAGGHDNVTVQVARLLACGPQAASTGSSTRFVLAVLASVLASLMLSGAIGCRLSEDCRHAMGRLRAMPFAERGG